MDDSSPRFVSQNRESQSYVSDNYDSEKTSCPLLRILCSFYAAVLQATCAFSNLVFTSVVNLWQLTPVWQSGGVTAPGEVKSAHAKLRRP